MALLSNQKQTLKEPIRKPYSIRNPINLFHNLNIAKKP